MSSRELCPPFSSNLSVISLLLYDYYLLHSPTTSGAFLLPFQPPKFDLSWLSCYVGFFID